MSAREDHSGGRVASAVASSAVTHLRQLEQLPEIRRIPYALCGSELEHLTHGVGDEVQPTIVAAGGCPGPHHTRFTGCGCRGDGAILNHIWKAVIAGCDQSSDRSVQNR